MTTIQSGVYDIVTHRAGRYLIASALKERSTSQEHFIDSGPAARRADDAEALPVRRDVATAGRASGCALTSESEYEGKGKDLDTGLRTPPDVRTGAGDPAAADRLRHAALRGCTGTTMVSHE